jgi:hypothetical protein
MSDSAGEGAYVQQFLDLLKSKKKERMWWWGDGSGKELG